jgi:hypothetical protein
MVVANTPPDMVLVPRAALNTLIHGVSPLIYFPNPPNPVLLGALLVCSDALRSAVLEVRT